MGVGEPVYNYVLSRVHSSIMQVRDPATTLYEKEAQ
jgi:hypothetical protein